MKSQNLWLTSVGHTVYLKMMQISADLLYIGVASYGALGHVLPRLPTV